mmetsp:Transcript_29770/g.40225  ORF Transcript_29770/g.40225 Transcript_29770/m.40225 type:complete len:85 (+) Transcript_29770:721-975(+)
MMELLHGMGANTNTECNLGNQCLRPILLASKLSYTPMVQFIINVSLDKKGVCNCTMKSSGSTALHLAAYSGNYDIFSILVENGA